MKRITPCLVAFFLITTPCFSQDLISKVPSNASALLTYSSAALTEKVPARKFDSYLFLKKKLFKELGIDEKTPLSELGIDLQQNAYQYFANTDTSMSFVTLLPIKDPAKFAVFIQKKNKHHAPIESKSGFKVYSLSNTKFLAWNDKLATLVVVTYSDYYRYHYPYENVAADSTVAVDTAMAVLDSVKMAAKRI